MLTLFWDACRERISYISSWTTTYWIMINNVTPSKLSASTRTWVFTCFPDTSFILWTFRANYTFRSA